MSEPGLFIDGVWRVAGGAAMQAEDPVTGRVVWSGNSASTTDVDTAVQSARAAFPGWAGRSFDDRAQVLTSYAQSLLDASDDLARAIATDTGKPHWEALTEASAMVRKVAISIDAYRMRTGEYRKSAQLGSATVVRHRPHGVMAVFGPFNFPGHLPNGHIVPALLAGNAVVFKPSEKAPLTGAALVRHAHAAGVPPGVLNLVQGDRVTGAALAESKYIDGLLFTGSANTGRVLHRAFADRPEAMLALEMGGNNALVVWGVNDIAAAAWTIVLSAFLTAGQRCTCARRLIVSDGIEGQAVLDHVVALVDRMRIGAPDDDPEPFMGPVIDNDAAEILLAAQADLMRAGAVPLREMKRLVADRPFLSPGVLDVTPVGVRADEETFGPLLQVIRVRDFAAAVVETNATRFGLAAGLLSDDPGLWTQFLDRTHAGVVNWNRPTAGAPSDAPFGGVGASGNHRPSAFYAADYCAYPVTSVESATVAAPDPLPRGFDE